MVCKVIGGHSTPQFLQCTVAFESDGWVSETPFSQDAIVTHTLACLQQYLVDVYLDSAMGLLTCRRWGELVMHAQLYVFHFTICIGCAGLACTLPAGWISA